LSSPEIAAEQEYVSMLYGRLDDLRGQAADRLAGALRSTGGTPQERSQRNSTVAMYAEQVEQFGAVESGLCFGRLDFDDGGKHHIGRIGIFDDTGDYQPLLVDWRAPAARPFYLATAAAPDGVRRRRHVRTRDRKVVNLDDEVLDLSAVRHTGNEGLTGEAALLAAVNAGRTGRMSDIVQTIQRPRHR
jgi:DNA helicase IV